MYNFRGVEMKKRLFLIFLTLSMSVTLAVGTTMAYFTADDSVEDITFTNGYVDIEAESVKVLGNKNINNVNPGSCYSLVYKFKNTGSKKIQLRIVAQPGKWDDNHADVKWTGINKNIYNREIIEINKQGRKNGFQNLYWERYYGLENVYVIPHPSSSNWKIYQKEKGSPIEIYYIGEPIEPGEAIELRLVIYFDLHLTGKAYEKAKFHLGGKVEAVQATNGAPEVAWGDTWNYVTSDNYEFEYTYWYEKWHTFDPNILSCYKNGGSDPTSTPSPTPTISSTPTPTPTSTPTPTPTPTPIVIDTFKCNKCYVQYDCNNDCKGYGDNHNQQCKTQISGTIFNAKDINGNFLAGQYKNNVNVSVYLKECPLPISKEDLNLYFNKNGKADFMVEIYGYHDIDKIEYVVIKIDNAQKTIDQIKKANN